MTDEHGEDATQKEVMKTTDKIRDIEFRLINDINALKEMSTDSQNYRSKDINMLKLILCSGLYPQVAIADEFNTYKRDCDQFFHTKVREECQHRRDASGCHALRRSNLWFCIPPASSPTIRIVSFHRRQTKQ